MKVYNIVFSPTGGTQKVSRIICNAISNEITTIDLLKPSVTKQSYTLSINDLAIISVPSFGGRVPSVALERLSSIHSNGAKAILVCVYGNRAFEDTLVELEDATINAGFTVIAAISAVAQHSIATQFASGRPDSIDTTQLVSFAKQIKEKLNSNNITKPSIPGNRPYKANKSIGMVPKPNKNCNHCGFCAKECPVRAIDINNPKNVNNKLCISCMRCVSICPQSARNISKTLSLGANIMLKKVCSDRKENQLYI